MSPPGDVQRDAAASGSHWTEPFAAPKTTTLPIGTPPFEYVDVGGKIPNYIRSQKWGTQGKPLSKMQKPLAPERSIERMVVPVGFHVELFAAEPHLGGKPLCMSWDERGRLWVCESVDYPNELRPENRGRDRIRICEDTDGDGRADRFTVFAESLSIPTSLTFARGGVIVHNGTETLFLKDTDGDDRADERRVLFSAWSLGDTHGGPSNMQYGLDNWIWGMQGYNKSAIRVGQKVVRFAQGFHRFRPDGSAIEFVRSTNNNTWGFGMSEEGIIFGSTANGCPSVYMPIANRFYERVRGWTPELTLASIADSNRFLPVTDKVRQVDHHGGYTAAAGHALYTARAYPQAYWNRVAFVCEPTGHLVSMMVLSAAGADFHATNPANLLASDDEWVAPVMAEVGPDGSVWAIDWYNYIVQHNPTPEGFKTGNGAAYETDLRDKQHGRIYRIVYDAAPRPQRMDLSRATPEELVATLANDNLLWRRHAQRLLVERAKLDVVPSLVKLVENSTVDEIGLNVGAIHALWTLQGLGALADDESNATRAVFRALHHPSAGVRRNAAQVLPPVIASTNAILTSGVLDDVEPQVRLQTVLALAELPPSPTVGPAVAEFMSNPNNRGDHWLMDAATCAAATNAVDFLTGAAGNSAPSPELKHACRVVANHLARSKTDSSVGPILLALTTAQADIVASIVHGFDDGWPSDAAFADSEKARSAVKQLLDRLPLEEKVRLARLAARGEDPEMRKVLAGLTDDLLSRLDDDEMPSGDRLAAAALLVTSQPTDDGVSRRLLEQITPRAAPEFCLEILRILKKCDAPVLGAEIVERLPTLMPDARDAAIELLLSRPRLARELVSAVETGKVNPNELSLAQKQLLAEYPDRKLRERARLLLDKIQQNAATDRKDVLAQFAALANERGDPKNGQAAFAKNCLVCHRYQGDGTSVGPDLTGMGVHGKQQLLVHLLDPNRDVENNYQAYVAVLVDGRVLNGLLAGESATSVEFIDNEGQRRPVLREEIEELTRTGRSLMPEGFEKHLSRAEIADILEFLTMRTQFVPLDVGRVATVSTFSGMFQTRGSDVERIVFDDWGSKSFGGVPFYPIDPQGGRVRNAIMLHGDLGNVAPSMPKAVQLPCGAACRAIHFLSGVSGWGFPATKAGTVSMIVRLHYADGATEDHPLTNGVHFADYLGHTEVSGSQLAFSLGRQQLRYLKIEPKRGDLVQNVELVKGPDATAPVVMAVTAEQR